MLRTALSLILFLFFSVWLGIELGQDPGRAFFTWKNTTVEMPLWFAACGLLLAVFLAWQLSNLFGAFPHALYRLRIWRKTRRLHKNAEHMREGLLDLLLGRFQKAERRLSGCRASADLHPIPTLGAAFAAHKQQAFKRRDAWMAEAGNTTAARIMQADFALDADFPDQAVSLLKDCPSEPAVLIRLKKAYRRLNQWEPLFALIPALRKAHVLTGDHADRFERKTACAWLATADNALLLQAIWGHFSRALRQDIRMVRTYAAHLLHFAGTVSLALPLITTALSRQFDSTLIQLYVEKDLGDPKKKLSQAEKWLKAYPHHPALLLALGQLALRCRLWGKARGYLQECLDLDKNNLQALAHLGWLDEQAGDTRAALAKYREGLLGLIEKNSADETL